MSDGDCLFCSISSGDIPATFVHQDESAFAIRDINPQAPTHVLVIPRRHITSFDALQDADNDLLGHLASVCRAVAHSESVDTTGYRVVSNVGTHGGQSVPHLHFHVLGGRQLNHNAN